MEKLVLFLCCLCFLEGNAQKIQLVIPSGHYSYVDGLAISPDGNYVLSGGGDGLVKIWNLDGREIKTLRLQPGHWATALAFSPDSRYILAGSMAGEMKVWGLEGNLHLHFSRPEVHGPWHRLL